MRGLNDILATVQADRTIADDDVLALRRIVWTDGGITEAEADMLFAIAAALQTQSPVWTAFFAEAIPVYVVDQREPRAYVDQATADWLVARLDADRGLDRVVEVGMLIRILEKALSAPETLRCYAMRAVEALVLAGDPPRVDDQEVRWLRALVFAAASDGPGVVSRAEAESLFRIKDATIDADNSADWPLLFVQGVGNHMLAHAIYRPIAAQDAVRLEALMDDASSSVLGFLKRMVQTTPAKISAALSERPERDIDAEVAAAAAITPVERAWLDMMTQSDGRLDPIEQQLGEFLAANQHAA